MIYEIGQRICDVNMVDKVKVDKVKLVKAEIWWSSLSDEEKIKMYDLIPKYEKT